MSARDDYPTLAGFAHRGASGGSAVLIAKRAEAVAVLKEIDRLRVLADLLAVTLRDARADLVDAATQGTGTVPGTVGWEDYCMSTWEGIPDDLARIDAALARYRYKVNR